MTVVDPRVVERKVGREIEAWTEQEALYRQRGWVMLARDGVKIDVGFLASIPLGGASLTAMTACVRFDYADYDLQPPSLEFIDAFSGAYAPPLVPAIVPTDEGPRNLLVGSHPNTNRPFLCVPGTREYHEHPQHSGDSWLLHRGEREGSLGALCDRIWRGMARSVVGLRSSVTTLPAQSGQTLQVEFQILTGDIDAMGSPAAVGLEVA